MALLLGNTGLRSCGTALSTIPHRVHGSTNGTASPLRQSGNHPGVTRPSRSLLGRKTDFKIVHAPFPPTSFYESGQSLGGNSQTQLAQLEFCPKNGSVLRCKGTTADPARGIT